MYTQYFLIYGTAIYHGDRHHFTEAELEGLYEQEAEEFFQYPYDGGGHTVVGWVEVKNLVTLEPNVPENPVTLDLAVTERMKSQLQEKIEQLNKIKDFETGEPMNVGDKLLRLKPAAWYWVATDV